MIKITNLNKYYNKGKVNELHVINETSLELPDKGLISFLGPSGSGKTTLLNVIGGLDRAQGTIVYDEIVVKNYEVGKIDRFRKDNIGYIFQNYNLLPNLTVYENLVTALELMGVVEKTEVSKRIEYTLKAVGMYKYRKKLAYALSGGQQQRVAIARALLKNAKIIIADEPTGNLDSENTVEVMNILKKISKTTLVLLVTHDIGIAKFYSDKIIEVKDGVVLKEYENIDRPTVLEGSNNNIYLKDLCCEESNSSFGSFKLYHNEGESANINIEVVVRNGNYYIKTDKPIKLVEASNLHLINAHQTTVKREEIDESSYDTSWFVTEKRGVKQFLATVLRTFKEGLSSLRKLSKKAKLINLSFVFMGMLAALGVVCLINFSYVDTTSFIYADNHYQFTTSDHTFQQDPMINLIKNYQSGNFENLSLYQPETDLILRHRLTFQKGINVKIKTMVGHYDTVKEKQIIYGNVPVSDKEVVVDMAMANKIANQFGNRATVDKTLGKEVTLSNGSGSLEVTIVGVIEGSQNAVFGNERFYRTWCCPATSNYFGEFRYFKYEVDSEGEPLYEIIEGEGFSDNNSSGLEVLLPVDSEYAGQEYAELIETVLFKVVGVYKYKDGTFNTTNKEFIVNTNMLSSLDEENLYKGICINNDEYSIVKGREPQGLNECAVSVYLSRYKIGDMIEQSGKYYEVVGKYCGSTRALSARFIQTKESFIFNHYDASEIMFAIKNENVITSNNEIIRSLYDVNMINEEENRESNIILYQLLFFVLIFICSVFSYFVMRSRTITLIYDVGVERSIGATKWKILGKFLVDTLIITTLFSLVGYIAIILLYNFTADAVNYYLGELFLISDTTYFIVGVLIMYLINVIFGMLPIISLLRKTPAEICAKYDI